MLECPNCRARHNALDLIWPIPDVCEKVLPGEIMPLGECPDCGELIYDACLLENLEETE